MDTSIDLWSEYLDLWKRWSLMNPSLLKELRELAKTKGNVLSDVFANTDISQARALAEILNGAI